MKTRILIALFAFAICLSAFFSVNAQVRAVWVRPFVNADTKTRKSSVKGREFIRLELEKIKRANLNTVYVESWAKEFRAGVPAKTKIYPAIFIGHFYEVKEKRLDARYLDLREKFEFHGFGLFAAQSLTDDLIEKLAKKNR